MRSSRTACLGAIVLAVSLIVTTGSAPARARRSDRPLCDRSSISRWRPSSRQFTPLPDSIAAVCVRRVREIHPGNTPFNRYVPSAGQLRGWQTTRDKYNRLPVQVNPYYRYVTGDFRGTTDEIIQWAAAKWGIPVDWLRAQYAQESAWHQQQLGDPAYVGPTAYYLYPPQARIPGTFQVYETMGMSQIKWVPDGSIGAGTEPMRWESTAFSVDYEAATVRFFYDDPGHVRSKWGDASYRPGQAWNSIAGWYDPYPWGNAGQETYARIVQSQLRRRTWTKRYF